MGRCLVLSELRDHTYMWSYYCTSFRSIPSGSGVRSKTTKKKRSIQLDGRAKWPAMARVGRSRLMMMGVLARSAFASTTCCSLPLGRGVFLFILRLTFGHARGAPPAYQRAGGRSIQAAGVLPRRRSKQLRVRVWACARRRAGSPSPRQQAAGDGDQ